MSVAEELEGMVLTAKEVAAVLRCSPDHVYELVKRGDLRAMGKVGRRTLIPRTALIEFIEARS